MDLGIAGRKAIVGGASAGLGKACAMSLAREGVEVTIVARTQANIEAAAAEIRAATGVKVTPVAVDINSDEGRAAILEVCPEPDIVVNNSGGPPTGNFRDWDRKAWMDALNSSMLGAVFMIKDVVDGMIARKFGRIVNITSHSVKAPIPILGLSNSARLGLTGFVAGVVPGGRQAQRDDQQHLCPANSTPSATVPTPGRWPRSRTRPTRRRGPPGWPRSPQAGSEPPRNSARSAPSSAAFRPHTSPARIS